MSSASTPAPDPLGSTGNLHKSHFQQTVCLTDWWLVKAENDVQGRRLAVAGLTDWGKHAMRVFTSAPILKRYDVCTLETSDGICVILDGFINKARTLENGFPADVFNYFVFGFPPYWKDYDEKFVAKVPSTKDISRDDLIEKIFRQLGSMESSQQHRDIHEKYSGSEGKMDAKSKKSNSVTIPFLKKCSTSGSHKESYSGSATGVEDHNATELAVNELKNEMKSLSDLNSGVIKVQATMNKHVNNSKIFDSGGTPSACHLNKKRTKENADNLRKIHGKKKTSTDFDRYVSSSERFVSCHGVRMTTRSMSSLKMKQTNNKKSIEISDGEKIRLNSTPISSGKVESELSFDREPGRINNLNSEDKSITEIKIRSKILKVKNKATESPCKPAASTKLRCTSASVDNKSDTVSTGKNSLSDRVNASDLDTNKKSVPVRKETPESENKKENVSPQSFSYKRSRSGRLLMPTLEFWRNQRAVYDADRTITGIDEGPPTA